MLRPAMTWFASLEVPTKGWGGMPGQTIIRVPGYVTETRYSSHIDVIPGPTLEAGKEASEFERFEDLTRKLVNTPKPKRD
jgi:hypothetical protein